MAVTSTWLRQLTGAAGASLLLPIVVLAAAGALAIGGLGGPGSLEQVAAGPDVPDLGLPASAGPAAEEVELAAVDSVTAGGATAGGGAATGGAAGPVPGTGAPTGGGTDLAPAPGTGTPTAPQSPSGGGGSPGGTGTGGGPGAPAAPPTSPTQPLTDTVREVGDQVPAPLAPVTDEVLDTVLGPPR